MANHAETELRETDLPDDIVKYKPISPSALMGLFLGLVAVIAAIITPDVGWSFLAAPIVGLFVGLRSFGSIRRYDMAGRGAARVGVVLSGLALIGGTAHHIHYLKTAIPPGYMAIDYEPLQPRGGEQIPAAAQELNGKQVYIQGYIYPPKQAHGIRSFVLCRDNSTCCFGGQPKLTDMVEIKLKDPLRLDYTSSLRGVGGKLRVSPEKDPSGLGTVLYHIDDADVLH